MRPINFYFQHLNLPIFKKKIHYLQCSYIIYCRSWLYLICLQRNKKFYWIEVGMGDSRVWAESLRVRSWLVDSLIRPRTTLYHVHRSVIAPVSSDVASLVGTTWLLSRSTVVPPCTITGQVIALVFNGISFVEGIKSTRDFLSFSSIPIENIRGLSYFYASLIDLSWQLGMWANFLTNS